MTIPSFNQKFHFQNFYNKNINSLNYLAKSSQSFDFLGFAELKRGLKDTSWALSFEFYNPFKERTYLIGVHLSKKDMLIDYPMDLDHQENEIKLIKEGHTVVLFFKGIDDRSYFKRFVSHEQAYSWLNDFIQNGSMLDTEKEQQTNNWFYFN